MSRQNLSAQIHVVAMRGPIAAYLRAMIAWSEEHAMQPAGARLFDRAPDWMGEPHNPAREVASPWRYSIAAGQVCIELPEPWRPSSYILGQLVGLSGTTSSLTRDSVFVNGPLKGRKRHADRARLCGSCAVLTQTSKMGCMSFNLPAGPPRMLGACPGALVGWRTPGLPVGKDAETHADLLSGRSWDRIGYLQPPRYEFVTRAGKPGAITPAEQEGAEQSEKAPGKRLRLDAETLTVKALTQPASKSTKMQLELARHYGLSEVTIDGDPGALPKTVTGPQGEIKAMTVSPDAYICNGCYALKGSYGTSTTVFGMVLKLLWVKWCVKYAPQEFVAVMRAAIEGSRRANAEARVRLAQQPPQRSTIAQERMLEHPDPEYFRIHDSGDFYSSSYLGLWLQIIDSFPEVHFWAPTRLWFSSHAVGKMEAEIRKPRPGGHKGLPPNLVLRPSALHFGEQPPSLPQLTGHEVGSGAADPEVFLQGQNCVSEAGRITQWACPAYRPYTEDGGGMLYRTAEDWSRFEKAGACQIAHGLKGATCAEGRQQTCRVCWKKDCHVVYKEH